MVEYHNRNLLRVLPGNASKPLNLLHVGVVATKALAGVLRARLSHYKIALKGQNGAELVAFYCARF